MGIKAHTHLFYNQEAFKNKKHIFKIGTIEQCWVLGNLNRERSWNLAEK